MGRVVDAQTWSEVEMSLNNNVLIWDSASLLLNNQVVRLHACCMKRLLLSVAICVMATSGHAACYADYKAKRDNPLRLHYGVAQISAPCSTSNASQQLSGRLDAAGWTLLNVIGTFDASGLAGRRQDAGQYYLRY